MKTTRYTLIIVSLLLLVSACTPMRENNQATTEPVEITATVEEPTSIPPTYSPPIEQFENSPVPNGFLVVDHESDLIRLVSIDGQVVDEWGFPGLNYGPQSENKFHFGGKIADGLIAAPCIYVSSLSGEPQITYHQDKALIPLRKISQLINLVGAPGSPQVAYGFLDSESLQRFEEKRYQSPSNSAAEATSEPVYVHSWIYAGSPETLGEAQPIVFRADENGLVLYPLVLKMEHEELVGVWYTLEPKGSAGVGPIFFGGFSRLYFADLGTGLVDEVLGTGAGTLALSPGQSTVAFEETGVKDQPVVTFLNLATGISKSIDVLPDTHPTGVGDAHFSPSGVHLAWREVAMGDDTIFSIIRISSPTHDDLIEFDTRDLISKITTPEIHSITLAGWLDNETLLIEVHSNSGVDLHRLSVDDGELANMATGDFVEFTYR